MTESNSSFEAPAETTDEKTSLREAVIEQIKTVYDPEIPVNVYELGLIYEIHIEDNMARIRMTLTAPGCPVAPMIMEEVEQKATLVPGIDYTEVELVWDPPWNPGMMSEAARLTLGM